jgi:hypothetical protein
MGWRNASGHCPALLVSSFLHGDAMVDFPVRTSEGFELRKTISEILRKSD